MSSDVWSRTTRSRTTPRCNALPHAGATLLFLLCLSACGRVTGNHYLVEADPSFSPSDIEAIQDAARSWEAAVDGLEMPIVIASCHDITAAAICIHASGASEVAARSGVPQAAGHTIWNDVGGETWMRIPSSRWFEREVAHEMGHAMGLQHNAKGTLMYFSASGESPAPTADDVAAWLEVRGLQRPGV